MSKVIGPEVVTWISQGRSAPFGKLWALRRHIPSDLPVGTAETSGLVVSGQLARELGWPKLNQYPDWPGYPATAASGPHACQVCGEKHLTADRPFHSQSVTTAPVSRQSVVSQPVTGQSVIPSQSRCEVCDKPLRPRAHPGGSPQRFCSGACQQVAKRASRT